MSLPSPRSTTRVASGVTYFFIQGFASSAVSLVYFVVLTYMLPNEEMGVYALLSFTLSLVPVLGASALPFVTVKYLAQYPAASFVALTTLNFDLSGPALARAFSAIITFGLSVFALKRVFSINFDNITLSEAAFSYLLMVIAIFLIEMARRIIMSSSNQLFDITLQIFILYIVVSAATYSFL